MVNSKKLQHNITNIELHCLLCVVCILLFSKPMLVNIISNIDLKCKSVSPLDNHVCNTSGPQSYLQYLQGKTDFFLAKITI